MVFNYTILTMQEAESIFLPETLQVIIAVPFFPPFMEIPVLFFDFIHRIEESDTLHSHFLFDFPGKKEAVRDAIFPFEIWRNVWDRISFFTVMFFFFLLEAFFFESEAPFVCFGFEIFFVCFEVVMLFVCFAMLLELEVALFFLLFEVFLVLVFLFLCFEVVVFVEFFNCLVVEAFSFFGDVYCMV